MHLDEFNPKEPTQFWCNKCDAVVVDSEKPETGGFYVQFGHQYNSSTKSYDGAYTGVMFALCRECLKY